MQFFAQTLIVNSYHEEVAAIKLRGQWSLVQDDLDDIIG